MKHAMMIDGTDEEETGEVLVSLTIKEVRAIHAALSTCAQQSKATKYNNVVNDGVADLPGVGITRSQLLKLSVEFSHIPVW